MTLTNAPQLAADLPAEIPSILLPVTGAELLLPTTAVAEVVPYSAPVADFDAPDWILGSFYWRDQQVPVISYEILNQKKYAGPSFRSRVAVLNNTGLDARRLPFIAIITQGVPRLARVRQDSISERENSLMGPMEKMAVDLDGEEVVLPEVAALEQAYLDYLKSKV